jgi:thioredoxin 1
MNKKLLYVLIFILLLVAGGFYLQKNKSGRIANYTNMTLEDMEESGGELTEDQADALEAEQGTTTGGRYLVYDGVSMEKSAGNKRVLFFFANWCPTCIPADADFNENETKIPEDVTLIRVNYNDTDTDADEEELAKKYDITYQHTFVQIDSNGEVVTKWNGGKTAELLQNLK